MVNATGHTYGEWTTVIAATCTEKGSEKRACSCGAEETREVAVLDHEFVEGKCTLCGAEDPNYVPSTDDNAGSDDVKEPNFFERLFAFLMSIIEKFFAMFKKN